MRCIRLLLLKSLQKIFETLEIKTFPFCITFLNLLGRKNETTSKSTRNVSHLSYT